MTKTHYALYGLTVALILVIVYLFGASATQIQAGAMPGLTTNVASTSAYSFGTTAVSLMATSSCVTRIISTQASPIMLTFSDWSGQTPTALIGHIQAASTTIVYDADKYGCGLFKAYGFTTATTTVSETR